MVIAIKDVAEHFDCDYVTATKITNILLKAKYVSMNIKDVVGFSFATSSIA